MTPREIDAKIAEVVMGLRLFVVDTAFGEGHAWLPAGSDPAQCCTFGEGFPRDVDLPRYSTDPVASKALREKLATGGWSWDFETERVGGELKFWFFIYKGNDGLINAVDDAHEGIHETEEMAVALCGLKAYRVEV